MKFDISASKKNEIASEDYKRLMRSDGDDGGSGGTPVYLYLRHPYTSSIMRAHLLIRDCMNTLSRQFRLSPP